MRQRASKDKLFARRLRAIELLQSGLSLSAVARKVGCTVSSVYRWRNSFKRGGKIGLASKPHPGRPPKLTLKKKKLLIKQLRMGAKHWGYADNGWTQQRIAKVFKVNWGIKIQPSNIRRFLASMGYFYRRPVVRIRKGVTKSVTGRMDWYRNSQKLAVGFLLLKLCSVVPVLDYGADAHGVHHQGGASLLKESRGGVGELLLFRGSV